jgi:hypothetical protein
MSYTTQGASDVLSMTLQGVDPAWRASANAWLALHESDPGEAGTAVTGETTYVGYARAQITKATFWTGTGNSRSNASLVQWPRCTVGNGGATKTITHFSVVTSASGAGTMLMSGALPEPILVSNRSRPEADVGDLVATLD